MTSSLQPVQDWYDDPPDRDLTGGGLPLTVPFVLPSRQTQERFDDNTSYDRLDTSRVPSVTGGLPIDTNVANLLAGPGGLTTKPNMLSAIGAAFDPLMGMLTVVQVDLAAQQATVNDHSQSITELRAVLNQLILQGNALVFTSNNTYTPSAGVLSVDVILIGGGAGGAGGTASAFNGGPGGGGGGGGEVHVNIPATLLPKDGEDFASIEITIGAGGARGTVGNPGTGGGDTVFGAGLLTAGGGQGGMTGTGTAPGVGGVGGAGMIPGGAGGSGRVSSGNGWPGGNSTSAYDLHGGGGGGGGGTDSGIGGPGGIGGISAGGTSGNTTTRDGHPPSSIVATGAGGGAGGWSAYGLMGDAGNGAFPGGAGGGGRGAASATNGGAGAAAIMFIIEHLA